MTAEFDDAKETLAELDKINNEKKIAKYSEILPGWEKLTAKHARFLQPEDLKAWLNLLALHPDSGNDLDMRCFMFLPEEEYSTLTSLDYYHVEDGKILELTKTTADINGQWLVELNNGNILSIGHGTADIKILDSKDPDDYLGKIQKGFLALDYGPSLPYVGWIKRSVVKDYQDLSRVPLISNNTTIELHAPLFYNDSLSNGDLMFGPSCSVVFRAIALSSKRKVVNVRQGWPAALYFKDFGPQKVQVIKALMKRHGQSATEILQNLGNLQEEAWELGIGALDDLIDLQREYEALGAVVYLDYMREETLENELAAMNADTL